MESSRDHELDNLSYPHNMDRASIEAELQARSITLPPRWEDFNLNDMREVLLAVREGHITPDHQWPHAGTGRAVFNTGFAGR